MENTNNTSCIFQDTCVKSLCEFCCVLIIHFSIQMGITMQAMWCHVWTPCPGPSQIAWLCVTSEQPSEKSSSPENKTDLVLPIIFAFQHNSLALVKPYIGTTPMLGIPPCTSLYSADIHTPKCPELPWPSIAHWPQASWSGDHVFLSIWYSSEHAVTILHMNIQHIWKDNSVVSLRGDTNTELICSNTS